MAAPAIHGAIDAVLDPLNDEQRAAVTHGDGPLLIVAGAGTGKTQVVTRRIAWLIATKRARPEEILGLTFTDKAAAEMEARVDQLVPYGWIGATLSTFHAFCDRLMREHAIELGLTSRLRVDTPAEILVFLREHLFELGLDRYLPLGRPDEHLAALVAVFDRARDEDVSSDQYRAFAERLAAEAGDDPERRDRAASELEKARAYAAYQKLLVEHGRVDFGSQISLALRLLRERPYLRREYQQRFRYILVDEFQDTNHVQFELVKLLAGTRRNLTVVGDDDQSIYRFRGAKVENMTGFLEAFPGARVVLLRRNYRSGQVLLDCAHRLIRNNNPDRLEARDPVAFDKRLVAERPLRGEIEHHTFATASDEADAVVGEIAEQVRSGERRPGDIAILARTHRHLDPYALALRGAGLRFQRASAVGLYQRPEIALCLHALRTIADPDDGTAAFGVFGDPLFAVDPVDLARLSATARRRNRSLLQLAATTAATTPSSLSSASVGAIRRYVALHAELAAAAARRPTAEVLYRFVTDSGLLARLSSDDDAAAAEPVQNLNKLLGIVSRVGPLLRSDRVGAFMAHLDLLIEAGDDPQAAVPDLDEDAVQLLTAHNAKGLEFPVVYLVQLVQQRFPLFQRSDQLPFPPELQRGGGDPKVEQQQEERRLFYVAMTRARDRLVLTHASDYGGKSLRKVSTFVVEALGLPAPPKVQSPPSVLESIARYAPVVEPQRPARPGPAAATLELSHGQIDDFLTCPLKYRYAHVVQVPLATDPVAMYGIALHHAIRIFLQHRMKGIPIAEDGVLEAFESAWSSEGFYSREHEERRHAEGRDALRRFVAREESSSRTPLAVEMEFRFPVGTDRISGRWDRIDETPSGIVLVDYKTTDVADPDAARERARRSMAEGQLGLYAWAYHETRGVTPHAVQLHFVATGAVGEARVAPEHLAAARDRVVTAAAGIRAGAFPARPDPNRCRFCPYNRLCPASAAHSAG
jgi:DNA helicase-2/ATP-dependent DNA helicase PcrA